MKQIAFWVLALCASLYTSAQTLSLEVNNQVPGLLFSNITSEQQQTLRNLKVTGYINGTDIKFIRELNTKFKLHGVLDLEGAYIIAGGDPYHHNYSYTTKTNTLTDFMFADLDSLQKVILPISLTSCSGRDLFSRTYVDTLVINGTMESLHIGNSTDNRFWKTRCIYIPEGVKILDLGSIFHSYAELKNQEIFFPSTIETISGANIIRAERNPVFHCKSTIPENIEDRSALGTPLFMGGTIYVPKGTKSKYEQSIFRNLVIIEDIPIDSVAFRSKRMSGYVGSEIDIFASVYPLDAARKNIYYDILDHNIIELNEAGQFVGKNYGKTQIYAYSFDKKFSDICEVQIYEHTTGIEYAETASVKVGEELQLQAATLPKETSDNQVTYQSSDKNIATVSADGTIYGISKGNAIIIAKSVDGSYTRECVVNVLQPVETVVLSDPSATLEVGEEKRLSITINPSNADNKNIVWNSSNPQIASIDNGTITAIKAGTTIITATSEDNANATDYCKVTVTQPVSGISLDYSEYILDAIGATFQLIATIEPENATNKSINWKSSDENVCIVSNGQVVAVGYGTSVIIATTADGGYFATCTVKVDKSTGIESIDNPSSGNYKVYSIDGKLSSLNTKGFKIIRFSNGTNLKLVVK